MSDTVLGIIIGGAIALIGTAIGTVVQGLISKRITKLQTEASRQQQEQQFNFQKQESQTARLIEVRAAYLNPLKEQIDKCVKSYKEAMDKLRTLRIKYPDSITDKHPFLREFLKDKSFAEMVDELDVPISSIEATSSDIEILDAQVSDKSLSGLILDITWDTLYLRGNMHDIRRPLLQRWTNQEEQEQQVDYSGIETTLEKLIGHLRDANCRIEQLLSGSE